MSDGCLFGEQLRRHRERRNISLATISRQTKVNEALYAALERGDCSRWPAAIYSRAYVRDYAIAVGLDPNRVVAEFAACFLDVAASGRRGAPAAARHPPASSNTEPLRLVLECVPGEHWRRLAARILATLAELLAIVVVAAIAAVALRLGFWPTLAAAALTCHMLGRILPNGLSTSWRPHWQWRSASSRSPSPESDEDALHTAILELR